MAKPTNDKQKLLILASASTEPIKFARANTNFPDEVIPAEIDETASSA